MNFKNFLPFDNVRLLTKLTETEAQHRIENITEPKKNFNFSIFNVRTKPYEGKLVENSFEINRNINYQNSFLPIIKGEITSYMGKTEVIIKMRPVIFVLVFMSFWLVAVGMVCVVIAVSALMRIQLILTSGFPMEFLIPFVIFALGYGLLMIAYKAESRKSKAFLKELLEAEEP